MLSNKNNFIILNLKNIMKKIEILLMVLFFTLFFNQSQACDLLDIDIGGDKSSIENIFGEIEDISLDENNNEKKNLPIVNEYDALGESFCEDINLGEVLITGYVKNNIIGALRIEVQNGETNEESEKGLLKTYMQSNFGEIDTESDNWQGYKLWNIGDKIINYYKIKNTIGEIREGVVVTSREYYEVLFTYEQDFKANNYE